MLSRQKLSTEQWVILEALWRGPRSQRQLAKLAAKAPTITRTVDLLVRRELVTRQKSTTDRRATVDAVACFVTASPSRGHARCASAARPSRRRHLEGLRATDRGDLVEARIDDALERPAAALLPRELDERPVLARLVDAGLEGVRVPAIPEQARARASRRSRLQITCAYQAP